MLKNFKLDLACTKLGKDITHALEHVKVDKDNTVATNGHIMAVIPTNELFDAKFIGDLPEGGILIHHSDYKKMSKYDIFIMSKIERGFIITCIDSRDKHEPEFVNFKNPFGELCFPDYKKVLPKEKDSVPLSAVGISGKLLSDLQKVLGNDSGLKITFYKGAAHKVEPIGSGAGFGIIMRAKF